MKLHRRRGWFSRWLDRQIPVVEGDVSLLDRTDGSAWPQAITNARTRTS